MKNLTVKQKLLSEMRKKGRMRTLDVEIWGLHNFTLSATRKARELAEENKIHRISKEDKIKIYGKIKDDVWIFGGKI